MNSPIQKLKSSKLFYNKWPYKVECLQRGASKIIHAGLEETRAWCNGSKNFKFDNWEKTQGDKTVLLQFIDAVEPFLKGKDLQIRVEGTHFNIFCKDITLLKEIDERLFLWIKKISGPTTQEELDFLLSNGHKKILCDQLPKGMYQYRIFFKTTWPAEKRLAFLEWSENYKEKLKLSGVSKEWLLGRRRWAQDPFMYVYDDKMLSMTGLYLSGYVKKVEKFIPRENVLAA